MHRNNESTSQIIPFYDLKTIFTTLNITTWTLQSCAPFLLSASLLQAVSVASWKLGCFEETAGPPNILTGHCVGISTMNQKDALSPAPRGSPVPHLECMPAQSCAMSTPRSAVCCPVSLCYRHPVLELLNSSSCSQPTTAQETKIYPRLMRAVSLN